MISKIKPIVSFGLTLNLSEEEARALDAVLGYDAKEFLKTFYEKMGKAYLQEHESGFLSLVKSSREQLTQQLSTIDTVWKKIKEIT